MKKLLLTFIILIVTFANAQDVLKIGVLAKRGQQKTLDKWSSTAKYLSENIDCCNFEIVPLKFKDIHTAIKRDEIDFVLTNSALYVELEYLYNISRIATMENLSDSEDNYHTKFGGVIFVRKDRRDISDISDIKGRRFMGVDKSSFGGYLMALRELNKHGINESDLDLSFAATHDKVVYSVLKSQVDVGTVRSDILERMAKEKKIDLNDFYVINSKAYSGFNFQVSTDLYPEWPIAKVQSTPHEVSQKVAIALLKMKKDDKAARDSKLNGWTIPLNYQSVHDCLKDLKVSPYDIEHEVTLEDFFAKYWYLFIIGSIVVVSSLIVGLYFRNMNKILQYTKNDLEKEIKERIDTETKLIQTQNDMMKLNSQLEQKVEERTKNIEQILDRERYLREILKTIADVNQVIIVSNSIEELIQKSCQHLVEYKDYTYAWISLADGDPIISLPQSSGDIKFVEMVRNRCKNIKSNEDIEYLECSVLKNNSTLIIEDVHHYNKISNIEKDEYLKNDINSIITLPLRKDIYSRPYGVLSVYSGRIGHVDIEEIKMLEELAGDLGFAINSYKQTTELKSLQDDKIKNYEETILSFVNMIEQRDSYTVGHTSRVANYARMIAVELGLSEKEITKLYKASILHDIGKISTPDSILLKPYRLSELEYKIIQEHVVVGYEMLSKIEYYKDLADIILYHHERYDGKGYPHGLKGDEIPLLSRIMAVADSFDAMTSQRIYKVRKSLSEALEELESNAGTQFDSDIAKVAVKVFSSLDYTQDTFQLPKTDIEKERMAYFYKDQLTNLYNKDYLALIIKNKYKMNTDFRYGVGIYIRAFNEYNKTHTWEDGNRVLKDMSKYLEDNYQDSILFRVNGDDFIILSDNEIDTTVLSNENMPLNKIGIEYKIVKEDINIEKIDTFHDMSLF
jgi:putative nucleotidyltransferase with HDIG domain